MLHDRKNRSAFSLIRLRRTLSMCCARFQMSKHVLSGSPCDQSCLQSSIAALSPAKSVSHDLNPGLYKSARTRFSLHANFCSAHRNRSGQVAQSNRFLHPCNGSSQKVCQMLCSVSSAGFAILDLKRGQGRARFFPLWLFWVGRCVGGCSTRIPTDSILRIVSPCQDATGTPHKQCGAKRLQCRYRRAEFPRRRKLSKKCSRTRSTQDGH